MNPTHPYSYTVLRYVHDVVAGEAINVGIVLHCPSERFLAARVQTRRGRLSAVFPDLDGRAFRSTMLAVARQLERLSHSVAAGDLLEAESNAASFARRVLPADDSSLQWSPPGTGLTPDPRAALDRLFDRMVARYDQKQEARRQDDDVWRPVRHLLEERKIADRMQEKIICGAVDTIEFKHAWKNGVWHCVQPLSFDLADEAGIKDKARRWTGHLAAVRDVQGEFKPYFVVAGPARHELAPAFENAVSILKQGHAELAVYREDQASALVSVIESEIKAHERGRS